uniref:Mastermind like transcriptional coactivator 1 n=1 Tax=Leptobrachium leishanense TaxID=445787 RepID=A0A8C5PZ26_9ANUR
MADFVVPRHSAVMERLRRRIELCRRHHGSCESRYDSVAGERLERERQHTLQLHQRCLQAKAKRAGKHRQPPPTDSGAGRGSQASTGSMEAGDGGGEQCRNSTLIAQLHETVKRKLDNASSPQNGEQNGYSDLFSVPKKLRHDDGLTGVIGSSNGIPPVSPLRPLDSKPPNGDSLQLNGNHPIGLDVLNKKCLPDTGLQLNGDADEFSLCLGKEMKQEPVDELPCMLSGVEGSISQNNLPDLHLNELEWKELIEELNKSVPDEDMGDLFSGDFEDKKDTDAPNSATQTPLPQDIHIKSEFSPAAFEQESIGSPQVRSASSGPYIGNSSVPAGSASPVVGSTHTVFQPSTQTVTDSTSQSMMQTSSQAPNVQRSLPNVLMPGQAAVSAKEMSSAHQLQQIAAKQKRDQLLQNQPQVHQTNQMTNWPQSRSSQSPIGVPYNMENPTSPSVYQQDFNNQKLLMQNMNKSSPRSGGNYMQPNHVNMMGHKPSGGLNSAQVAGANSMLDYGNTKPLSHYEADCGTGVVAQNQSKTAMLTYLQRQQQQLPHMTDEQNQMFMMKRKAGIPYRPLVPHGQEQNSQPGVPRLPVPASGPGVTVQSPAGNHNTASYLSSQQQAVMKQQLIMEQKQREQKQLLMEQQQKQQQYLLGQRQQQQQQLLAEQEKQRQQQEQALQRHLTRPPPQYQDQPQNSYQQQIGPFPGSSSVNNLNHPSTGTSHMFSQTPPMIPMGGGHASVAQMPSGSNSQDRAVSQYPNLQSVQRGALYNMTSGISQMVPNHATQNNLPNGQPPLQRPSNMVQANTLPAGYGQNPLGNAGLPPQHNKGAMNPALPKNQIPRMPAAMVSQNPSWQHQGMQNMNSQAQGNNVLGAFTAANAGFHLQQNHHKMANQQFGQGMSQVGIGTSRPMPSINSSVPSQMMPNLASQQRTNPASQQAAPNQQVLPVMNQSVPDLATFNQNPGPQMTNRSNLHCNQNYQVRSTNQDLPFGYGNQSGNSLLQNLSGDADLLDSLLKNRTSEEWMNDLDELLGNP